LLNYNNFLYYLLDSNVCIYKQPEPELPKNQGVKVETTIANGKRYRIIPDRAPSKYKKRPKLNETITKAVESFQATNPQVQMVIYQNNFNAN
jgi:hypothetical protein